MKHLWIKITLMVLLSFTAILITTNDLPYEASDYQQSSSSDLPYEV